MLRGLMRSSCRSVSDVSRKRRRIQGIHSGNKAFRRTDQG